MFQKRLDQSDGRSFYVKLKNGIFSIYNRKRVGKIARKWAVMLFYNLRYENYQNYEKKVQLKIEEEQN